MNREISLSEDDGLGLTSLIAQKAYWDLAEDPGLL